MNTKKITPLFYLFLIGIFFESLDAFSLFSIPLPWIGVSIFIFIYVIYYFFGFEIQFNQFDSLRVLLLYFTSVTLIRAVSYSPDLPEFATSSFTQYISLRLLKLLGFIAVIWFVYTLSNYFERDTIIKFISFIGITVSLLSLISYFSYIFDFQDFSRNRPGSGGWSQPIKRACSILRNYGTFREPSFLAVWLAPIIPLNFYLARKQAIWYGLSILPILAIILSRSLTGVISLILGILFAAVLWTLKNKNFDLLFIIPIIFLLFSSFVGNSLGYKFPALDPSMCPPESPDKCNCSLYDDKLDEAKNSESVTKSVFERITLITRGGLDGFENISILNQYISSENIQIFGQGLGIANLNFSPTFDDLTKKNVDEEIVYRNPGQIVSFNNLYINLYFSGGIIGLIWFLIFLFNVLKKLYNNGNEYSFYIFSNLVVILLMYFFQAEELSTMFAISLGLMLLEFKNEKV